MRNYSAKNVDEYIAKAPKEAHAKLKEIRAVVKSAVPKAEEGISYGIPFYKYFGLLVGFTPLKGYVSFGLAFTFENKDREILEKKGYKTGSKTVQIRFDQKVPVTLLRQMLKTKAKLNEAKKMKK
jgi:uncharacterized protein YdhG (YjbR/CyaY superfamily)